MVNSKIFFKKIQENILLFIVFITGASSLAIEIVAIRILSPYFGNSIYTTSSVIGIVLAALSLGYYFGGRMADKYPKNDYFYSIIALSGLTVLMIDILNMTLLPLVSFRLSMVSGPLLMSLLLFFIPSVLLGLLSPYAIKLQKIISSEQGIGTVAGRVYFWSTLGSIAGSLVTGFYLIPKLGINQIIFFIGVLLILIGLVPLIIKKQNKFLVIYLILAAGLITYIIFFPIYFKASHVYQKDGIYEKISIIDGVNNNRKIRALLQDSNWSSAIYLDSDELVFDYTKYIDIYKLLDKKPKKILIIGAGAYTVPRYLLKKLPRAYIDVVDIEPDLYPLSKKYFKLTDNKRLKNYIEDGRRFLVSSDNYDVIFSDVYKSAESIPAHFTTREFFELVKTKLNHNGIFIINLIGSSACQPESLLYSEIKTFKQVFSNSYFFAVDSPENKGTQNFIFLAYKGRERLSFNKIKNDVLLLELNKKVLKLSNCDVFSYPILTDNYSPVDYLSSKNISD